MKTEHLACPHCGFELELTDEMNDLQILFCPSCNREINLSLKITNDVDLVSVFLAENGSQRDVVVSLLESFGIQSTCKNVPFRQLPGSGPPYLGQDAAMVPCEIYVLAQNSEKARAIISDYFR